MTSIKVPEPVMSVALTPKSTDQLQNFQKALHRFQREDPTFHCKNDAGVLCVRLSMEFADGWFSWFSG
jgi:translation elongation factor EF-G